MMAARGGSQEREEADLPRAREQAKCLRPRHGTAIRMIYYYRSQEYFSDASLYETRGLQRTNPEVGLSPPWAAKAAWERRTGGDG